MSALHVCIEGIGFWSPGWPDWDAARRGLRGEAKADPAVVKPLPTLLAAAERRRAPLPVLLACEIAAQACAAAGHAPDTLPSVFAATHGDLVITDYMCRTLATAPRELSPIRFHNSVHNAPAGYWTIAANCHAGSTSISSWHSTFAIALFEAAVQALADDTPVLLAAYDTESPGPLGDVSPSTTQFGVAMVIAPPNGRSSTLRMELQALQELTRAADPLPAEFAALAMNNPMAAQSLPVLAIMASAESGKLRIQAGKQSSLDLEFNA
ncbi:MAG TPA: beta-ketoacyl synthase chain length factor [Dokdonella sp.]|uniref:beta-ketoacyl synthase chain length factor n=1 Tax=Dokdonella sp. TaxID=2291710 RepID=UPI002D7EA37E|nr:beta-ketoacyl synthase chain length factor [Dokdonella sp.]HET9033292.1 beta-ketoacyl synthase chain length factor [Dokdonella sp.]